MLHRPGSRAAGAMGTRPEPVLDSRLEVSLDPLYLYGEHFTRFCTFLKGCQGSLDAPHSHISCWGSSGCQGRRVSAWKPDDLWIYKYPAWVLMLPVGNRWGQGVLQMLLSRLGSSFHLC